jgi:hypothetical protein
MLAVLDVGKGRIRFSKSIGLSGTRFAEFDKKTMYMLRKGMDIGC